MLDKFTILEISDFMDQGMDFFYRQKLEAKNDFGSGTKSIRIPASLPHTALKCIPSVAKAITAELNSSLANSSYRKIL